AEIAKFLYQWPDVGSKGPSRGHPCTDCHRRSRHHRIRVSSRRLGSPRRFHRSARGARRNRSLPRSRSSPVLRRSDPKTPNPDLDTDSDKRYSSQQEGSGAQRSRTAGELTTINQRDTIGTATGCASRPLNSKILGKEIEPCLGLRSPRPCAR